MRRFIFRLFVALFTFAIGVSAAALWFIPRRSLEHVKVDKVQPAVTLAKQERTYRPALMAGKCATKEGYPCSFTNFESSDGMLFSQMSETYDSPKRAAKELEKKLKRAVEIVKREPLFDDKGRKVGEKVIATFSPYKNSSVASGTLLWTNGSRFIYVDSSSLQNILEYEKDSNR